MPEAAREYEVVPYRSELKPQLLELQTFLWSPDPALNAAYFEWKYERNPYVSPPLIYVALHNGNVVGMRGFFGTCWEAGSSRETFRVLYADDLVILPPHRRRGVVAKIMTTAFRDLAGREYPYAFSLSAGHITFLASLSLGWRSAGFVEPWRRPAGPQGFMRRLTTTRRWPVLRSVAEHRERAASFPGAAFVRKKRRLEKDSKVQVEDVPRVGDMADLVRRVGSEGRIRHVRDEGYFSWRLQCPLSRYRFVYLGSPRLDGYLVLQEYVSRYADLSQVQIVDWEATSPEAREELLRSAVQLAGGRAVKVWTATLAEETKALLAKYAFLAEEAPVGVEASRWGVLVKSIRDDGPAAQWRLGDRSLMDLSHWDLRTLYSMHG